MEFIHCPNCGEPSSPDARFCKACGEEFINPSAIPTNRKIVSKPIRRINKTDENVRDYLQSKFFRFWMAFFFIILCVLPSCAFCLVPLGVFPILTDIFSFLQYP